MQGIHLSASVAERFCLSSLRWGRRALEDVRWIAAVSKLSWAYIADGWNRFPRYTQAATDMVSCDVVRDQPEKRCQRVGLAAGARIWELRDCVDLAPQAASGDGSAWSGSSCRERRSRRDLCRRSGGGNEGAPDGNESHRRGGGRKGREWHWPHPSSACHGRLRRQPHPLRQGNCNIRLRGSHRWMVGLFRFGEVWIPASCHGDQSQHWARP